MARIIDVARHAGVSTATVSRVLNGKQVRPELAAAVHEAVAALDYSPDRTARSLRRRHSDVVALVVPDVENPFFTAVARGVEDVASSAGFSVVLCNTDDLPSKEEHYLAVATAERMAGVIVAPASSSPAIEPLLDARRPVVVIDRHVEHPVDQVTFDDRHLGHRAARALAERGFRRIACITGPATVSTAVGRFHGWRDALDDAGLTATEGLLVHANFRVDGGYEALVALLEQSNPPDAVVATNNLAGVGVLRALADRYGGPAATPGHGASASPMLGVAIVGDLPFATSRTSDVVLVPLNPRDLGVTAAELLHRRIEGDDSPARHVVEAATTGP